MTVRPLPPVAIAGHAPTSERNDDHPMRRMTRRAAGLDPGGWDEGARAEVADLFDRLAPEWHTRDTPERVAVVDDALTRGLDAVGLEPDGVAVGGLAVEVGAGLATYSPLLARHFDTVLAVEIAEEMLRLAPPAPAPRVLADCSRLPLADGAASASVMINAFLFPDEVARVLRPGGAVVWVNSSGTETPIHLRTDEVAGALPFEVTGVESSAGVGTWCVLRRER